MKLLPLLVLNAAMVAVGIFVYDQIRQPRIGPESADTEIGGLEVAPRAAPAASGGPDRPMVAAAAGGLQGTGLQNAIESNKTRLDLLEQRITEWTRALTEREMAGGTGGERRVGLDLGSEADLAEGDLNEATITALRAYLVEIEQRKRRERRYQYIGTQLAAAGIDLEPAAHKAVLEATADYQDAAQRLIRNPEWLGQSEGTEARNAAFEDLREKYRASIRGLVPRAEAERILETRLALTAGFFRAPTDGTPDKKGGDR